eukprot:2483908-Pleurochrysis_carterae.AAC.1
MFANKSDNRGARPQPELAFRHDGQPAKHWFIPKAQRQRHQHTSVITAELNARQKQLTRCPSALPGAKSLNQADNAIRTCP